MYYFQFFLNEKRSKISFFSDSFKLFILIVQICGKTPPNARKPLLV